MFILKIGINWLLQRPPFIIKPMKKTTNILYWGVILLPLIFPLYFLRFELAGIPFTLPEIAVYLLFTIFFFTTKKKFLTKPIFLPIALLLFAAIVSTIIVPDTFRDVTGICVDSRMAALGVLKGWVIMPILYFTMAHAHIKSDKDRKMMLLALMWSGVWLSIWGLLQGTEDGRASAFYESANYLALYLGPICVLFGVGLLESVKSRKKNYLLLLPGILTFIALIATKSYAGIIAVAAGLFFYLILSKKFTRKFKIAATVCAILACSLFAVSQVGTEKFQEFLEFEERASTSARLQIWHASYEMIKDSPLLGKGLGQYELNYQWKMTYLYDYDTYEWLAPHPHNLLMAIWLNFGLLGVVAMVAIIILAFSRTRGNLKLAIAAMLFAVLIHGLFDTPFMKNDLAMEFWLIIALLL